MFIIIKKLIAGLMVAGMFALVGTSGIAFASSADDETPTEIVAGGEFKIAKLNAEHLTAEYRLNKYDVINVLVVGFPDGIGVSDIQVGPDGYVQLPYAGTVKLAGLTIPEATELLTDTLGQYIKIPSMSIMIKSYGPRKIYVMGEVESPGIKDMQIDSLNVFAALSSAGGVKTRGRVKHVQVLRTSGDTMYYKEVNMNNYVKKHDMSQNLELQDGDIVYVPSSNKIVFSEDIMPYVSMFAMYKSITN